MFHCTLQVYRNPKSPSQMAHLVCTPPSKVPSKLILEPVTLVAAANEDAAAWSVSASYNVLGAHRKVRILCLSVSLT